MIRPNPGRYLTALLFTCMITRAFSQPACPRNSILYRFEGNLPLRNFTEKLGNHPEFPFLQRENGVSRPEDFIRAIQDSKIQWRYKREFDAFDALLRNSGFSNGYKDLSLENVEKVYIGRGTIGNLGFYDRVKDKISYIYVRLDPAGEDPPGTAAWKLTNKNGCFFYVLHTCGNAFYPESKFDGDCCRTLSVQTGVQPLELRPDSLEKKVRVSISFYRGRLSAATRRNKVYDTSISLLRQLDTTVNIRTNSGKNYRIYANDQLNKVLVCGDTVVKLYSHLLLDSTLMSDADPLAIKISDTTYYMDSVWRGACINKWEIDADAGISFNSIPRLDNATSHTQTNGPQLAGEFSIARIFRPWFMAGLSASYIILSYEDDINYPGSTPGTYNKIYLGKPIIPIQLFARATIGKLVGWQSTVSLAAGYSIPTQGRIENSGVRLSTDPALKGGVTAGFKLGLNYFFSCRFGLGLAFSGQYFMNSGALRDYKLFALPITGGIRWRF